MTGWALVPAIIQAAIVFATVAQGSNSEIADARQVVVRSAEEWQTLWRGHTTSAAPRVDFSKSIVIGVFLGTRPSAGYAVQITAVRPATDAIVVEYRERQPAAGSMTAQMLSSPFQLISIPRDNRKIEFRELRAPD